MVRRVAGLAGAAEITALLDGAIAARSSQMAVPRSVLRLDFGSLRAVRPRSARLAWADGSGSWRQAEAACQSGWLEAAPPADVARAQLLDAACQLAYGTP